MRRYADNSAPQSETPFPQTSIRQRTHQSMDFATTEHSASPSTTVLLAMLRSKGASTFRIVLLLSPELGPHELIFGVVLYTLKTACLTRPNPINPFSLQPSQIFTDNPPSNFLVPNSMKDASGLSREVKLAMAVCIPFFFFLFLSLSLYYCVLRRHRLKHALHSSPLKFVRRPIDSFPTARRPGERPHTNVPPIRSSQRHPTTLSPVGERSAESFELTNLPASYNTDSGATDNQKLLRPSLPDGLESWERRGIEQAAGAAVQGRSKSVRFSNAHSSSAASKRSGSAGRERAAGSGSVGGPMPGATSLPRTPGLPVSEEVEYWPRDEVKKSPSRSPRDKG